MCYDVTSRDVTWHALNIAISDEKYMFILKLLSDVVNSGKRVAREVWKGEGGKSPGQGVGGICPGGNAAYASFYAANRYCHKWVHNFFGCDNLIQWNKWDNERKKMNYQDFFSKASIPSQLMFYI